MTSTSWTLAAAAWTGLYVASKIHLALEGRLGVAGGPAVAPSAYDAFGPGEVAAAQWSNAAVGALGVLLLLLTLHPAAKRLPIWLVLGPWAGFALVAAAGAVGMIGRALTSEVGGAWFGAYCVVWTVLLSLSAREFVQRRRHGQEARRATGVGTV